MIEGIRDHVLDILQADSRIYRGHASGWATGFTGVKRIEEGVDAEAGYVNLFDVPYEPSSSDQRPAVYCGSNEIDCTDECEEQGISSVRQEFRIVKLPLVVVAQAANRKDARKQRSQIRANIMYILLEHCIEQDHWYELSVPGNRGGGDMRQVNRSSATGGTPRSIAEARAVIPLEIRYTFVQGGTAV
jgi:hypothetical protein